VHGRIKDNFPSSPQAQLYSKYDARLNMDERHLFYYRQVKNIHNNASYCIALESDDRAMNDTALRIEHAIVS
jgi:hypothetical protein